MKIQGAVSDTAQEGAALTTKSKMSRRERRTRTKHKKMAEAEAIRKKAERAAKEATNTAVQDVIEMKNTPNFGFV